MAQAQAIPLHKNRIPDKVHAELVEFANCLNPSPAHIKEGKEKVQEVFKMLQVEPNLSISRCFIGGSVGKNTSIIYPDFDCVVFMNKKLPPLKAMVDELETILKARAKQLKIDVKSIKKSSITVSMEFENGVEMDLLPASSFFQNPDDQYVEVMKRLKESPRSSIGFSSSLAETQLRFMKFQSSLTHQLVRIAKYWYKLCTFDVYIYGGSSIIEILCVDAALDSDKEGKGTSFSILQAFRAFLQKVKVVDTLKIAFYPEKDKFIRLQAKDFSLPKYKSHFYHKILELKNFIIEPANPYNNLAPNIKEDTLKRLKKFATEMLSRLAKLENTQTNEMKSLSPDGKDIALVHYDRLFEPFIMRLSCYPASAIPNKICVDYLYQNYDTAHVNAEVRPSAYAFFKEKKEAKFVYKTIMNNLLFLIRGKACRNLKKALSFTNGATDITKVQDVKDAVKLLIDANFGGKGMVTESSANKDHLDCYVTLSIPYRRMGKIYAVRFSMKWKN